ncbi:hypothetical protein V6N13_033279 [Hibiscus sabdariffa]|uniref:Cystatin domain-containing protein n=1 Tax=Hibiscus sabdariffa TaxID=183260 RepID=A0ABR2FAZ0_9ROSI
MLQNPLFLFFLVSLVSLPLIFSEARELNVAGEWTPIQNIDDPHVKEIAEFAVSEYIHHKKAMFKLVKVIGGKTQLASGMKYRLLLLVDEMMTMMYYEAVVWEKADGSKSLISFVKG